jgi:hypothetical protein
VPSEQIETAFLVGSTLKHDDIAKVVGLLLAKNDLTAAVTM